MTRSAFGARGERPVFFACSLPFERIRELTQIPGVARAAGGLRATWDVAPFLATLLGQPCPRSPAEWSMPEAALKAEIEMLPGLERYRRLELPAKLRDYQKEGALFLARRAWAMNCDPMRSGKTIQALAASVLIDAKKVLIVCPALAKYVWAEECAKWLREEAVILEGRGGDEARRYCIACNARGEVNGVYCEACMLRNRQSSGYKLFDTYAWEWDPNGKLLYECPRHRDLIDEVSAAGVPKLVCHGCVDELHAAIGAARYVVVNYDLLVGQKEADAAGALHDRDDLPGWGPALARHHFDLCIADEAHLLRGWSTDQSRRGQTRRERFNQVAEQIDTVWALTGTPIFGFTRDLWGPLDAISRGAMTGNGANSRLPFTFHARYCQGAKDSYGWKAEGRSVYADTELKERLKMVKIQRPRSLILSQMPPKSRQVIRVDPKDRSGFHHRKPRGSNDESKLTTLMRQTLTEKLPVVVENVVSEMSEGARAVVFALLRKSAEDIGQELEKAIQKHDVKTRMREVDAKVWSVHGSTSPQLRFEMARAFREHTGAGAFVATIDSVQVAVSLKGAASVHFADLHWQPAAMLQAEDRPYEPGVTGLSVVYYVVRGSVDEHVEATVLPKVVTLSRVVEERGADELRRAFANEEDEKKTLRQILDELLKHADTSLGAFDDDE